MAKSWIVDVRVGCVATYYAEEKRNWLDGISNDYNCVFYADGYKDTEGNWKVSNLNIYDAEWWAEEMTTKGIIPGAPGYEPFDPSATPDEEEDDPYWMEDNQDLN